MIARAFLTGGESIPSEAAQKLDSLHSVSLYAGLASLRLKSEPRKAVREYLNEGSAPNVRIPTYIEASERNVYGGKITFKRGIAPPCTGTAALPQSS